MLIIKPSSKGLFLFFEVFFLPITCYITEVMLFMCEIEDKGKGPNTEISTLQSDYLVIQVQESIKSNL